MSEINTGGPACSVCGNSATIKQGHQNLCDKHYRFGQMRAKAKRDGKVVPTRSELSVMLGVDLVCPDCKMQMNWRAKDGQATVASLQHYRDGSMSIVCRSCNTRHAFMEGDAYREMPKDHKRCPSCATTKPQSEFSADNGRAGIMKLKSTCKKCSDKKVNQWRARHKEAK